MPANILLLNVHSYCNAGDAALTEVAKGQLRQNFPGCRITVMINDPPSYPGAEETVISLAHWVKMARHWRALRLTRMVLTTLLYIVSYLRFGKPTDLLGSPELTASLDALIASDLVVCTPGGYIRSSGMGTTLFMVTYMIALAMLARKPVYYLPQSFGPLKHKWEVWIIRKLLSRARLVMAREPLSLQNLLKWGIPPARCHLFPDLAFAFQADTGEQGRSWLRSMGVDPYAGRPFLGVTVMNWGAQNRGFGGQAVYERAVAAAIRYFVENMHGKAFLLPQCWGPSPIEDDRVPARRVKKLLANLGDAVILVEHPLPPERLKSVFGQMDIFLGTRMHSNIFSLSQNVPIIAIQYNHKTGGIAQMAGIEKWVVDINRLNDKVLVQKMELLWAEREQVRQHLSATIPEMSRQACQPGVLLASDYATIAPRGS